MGDDGDCQVATCAHVDDSEQEAHQALVDDSGDTLVGVG